jgi:cell division protein FtsI/penicillin-binding protein 2
MLLSGASVAATAGCGLLDDGSASASTSPAPTAPPATATAAPAASPPPSPSAIGPSATVRATPRGQSTIDPRLQAAAERAVGGNPGASLVALDMRTGEILSTVHRQAGMSGAIAPGSTFKVLTAALLVHKGLASPSAKVPCPKTMTVNGQEFHNLAGMAIPDATLREDFARSCNTAFIGFGPRLADDELSAFATRYFGLNSNAWKVGTGQGSVDGVVPPATGPNDKAAQLIGQGALKMNPLTMASVVATALTGTFRQPVLERGMPVYKRTDTLPRKVTDAVRAMMVECATEGSAAALFEGMSGVGAKTGTAEVGDGTNGWMVAFRGHVAAAVYVEGGASGSSTAGPIIRDYLAAVSPTGS